jgi:hypothetical protein
MKKVAVFTPRFGNSSFDGLVGPDQLLEILQRLLADLDQAKGKNVVYHG